VDIAGLETIDWSQPWLAPIAELGRRIAANGDWRAEWNNVSAERNVRNIHGHRMSLAAGDAAGDEQYEAYIARTGRVPTRDNLHDFFNALMLLRFPLIKAQLNLLQSTAIARDGVRPTRGSVRDAATLIDENAVILVTRRTDLIAALRAHQWSTLFERQRDAWRREVGVIALGHALLEKLVRPYKAVTAHGLHVLLTPDTSLTNVDEHLAARIGGDLTPQCLMALPVLGIPGWWGPNEEPKFYGDDRVFRPANMRRQVTMEKQLK